MNLLTIPVKHGRRKWLRTASLVLVLILGVSSVTALVRVSREVDQSMERKLVAYGANIVVLPKKETLNLGYGGLNVGQLEYAQPKLDERATVESIRGIGYAERISVVAPKVVAMEEVNGQPVTLVGVNFEEEQRIKSYWAVHGDFPQAPEDVLAGFRAAMTLGLSQGSEIQAGGKALRVAGIIGETGGDEDSVIFVSLPVLQGIAGRENSIDFVEVAALCSGCPIDEIVGQISAALPDVEVNALRAVVEQRMFSLHSMQRLMLAAALVVLVTGCAMIGLSMFSAVHERRREIGLMRCLGFSRPLIFCIFNVEALGMGALAGVLGYVLGYGLGGQVLQYLELNLDATAAMAFWEVAAAAGLMALLAGLSATGPALRAARVEPSEALLSM